MKRSPILERYLARTPGSAATGTRAEAVLPGGDTRAAGFHLPYPLTLARGEGARVFDVDGNEYIDLAFNYTSLVHGHAFPPIVEAAERTLRDGTAWPARCLQQIELAETLTQRVASVDQVRFTNSGTEAAMLALHAARRLTGRQKMLMARFGYHGSHEAFEAGAFDGFFGHCDDTRIAEYGNAASFEAVLAEHGTEIAAVFLEPVMGAGGIVTAPREFFHRVREAARRAGALFVLDEVIAFRMATGGMQSLLDLAPDFTLFGKLIGGGFPVGAVGGARACMEVMDPRAMRMFHSGTFNGNPVSMAAGIVSVRALTAERIEAMHRRAESLEHALAARAAELGLPFSVRRVGSLLNLYFSPTLPEANLRRDDAERMSLFHLAGMNRGLYFASRGMLVLATVVDDAILAEVIDRARAALEDVASEAS